MPKRNGRKGSHDFDGTARQESEAAYTKLVQGGVDREWLDETLSRFRVSLDIKPLWIKKHNFALPEGMTERTFLGFFKRMDAIAEDIEHINNSTLVRMAKRGMFSEPSEPEKRFAFQLVWNLPWFLRFYSGLLLHARKTAAKLHMGSGKGNILYKSSLTRLLVGVSRATGKPRLKEIESLLAFYTPITHKELYDFYRRVARPRSKNNLSSSS